MLFSSRAERGIKSILLRVQCQIQMYSGQSDPRRAGVLNLLKMSLLETNDLGSLRENRHREALRD